MSEEIQAAREKVKEDEKKAKSAVAKSKPRDEAGKMEPSPQVVHTGPLVDDDEPEDDGPIVVYAEPKPKVATKRRLIFSREWICPDCGNPGPHRRIGRNPPLFETHVCARCGTRHKVEPLGWVSGGRLIVNSPYVVTHKM